MVALVVMIVILVVMGVVLVVMGVSRNFGVA